MARRPQQHIDTSVQEADASYVPAFITADEPHPYVKGVLHGDPGSGKTRTAGEFPKPLIIALEPGYTVLKQLPNADDIKIVHIVDKMDAEGKLERSVLQQVWDVYLWLKAGEHDRETVVIDTGTELHKAILDAVMRKPRHRSSPNVPETDDYIEVASKMKALIRYFRDLPMHVIWTCHSKEVKDKQGATTGIKPDLSDKLVNELAGAADFVLFCRVIEQPVPEAEGGGTRTWYTGQTQPINGVTAKDRSDRLRKPVIQLGWEPIAEAYGLAPGSDAAAAPVDDAPADEPESDATE
jgi:nicotinamidase-related amidase